MPTPPLSAADLNDLTLNARAEYDAACALHNGVRDRLLPPNDPYARDTRDRVLTLTAEIADVYEWRLEQIEALAFAYAADARELLDNSVSVADLAEDIARKAAS